MAQKQHHGKTCLLNLRTFLTKTLHVPTMARCMKLPINIWGGTIVVNQNYNIGYGQPYYLYNWLKSMTYFHFLKIKCTFTITFKLFNFSKVTDMFCLSSIYFLFFFFIFKLDLKIGIQKIYGSISIFMFLVAPNFKSKLTNFKSIKSLVGGTARWHEGQIEC